MNEHAQPLVSDIVDALDDLLCRFSALEAVEQLIAPQQAGSAENLSHVDRDALAFMFCLLNTAVREQMERCKALADLMYEGHTFAP